MQNYLKKVVILKEYLISDKIGATIGSAVLTYENGGANITVDFLKNPQKDLTIFIYGDDYNFYEYSPPLNQRFSFDFKGVCFFNKLIVLGFYGEKLGFLGLNNSDLNEGLILAEKTKKELNLSTVKYDDEVIATENYYKLDYETNNIFDKNANEYSALQTEKNKEILQNAFPFNEKDASNVQSQNFYQKVKNSVLPTVNCHPTYKPLNDLISRSNFSKICYNDNNFYYLGIIFDEFDNDNVLYVCYAIQSNYSNPPKNLEGYKFIPSSPFDVYGMGYFVIFQDAKTGEIIK